MTTIQKANTPTGVGRTVPNRDILLSPEAFATSPTAMLANWAKAKEYQGQQISPERLAWLALGRRGSVPTPLSFAQQMEEACKRTSARVRQVLAARGNTPTSGDAA